MAVRLLPTIYLFDITKLCHFVSVTFWNVVFDVLLHKDF